MNDKKPKAITDSLDPRQEVWVHVYNKTHDALGTLQKRMALFAAIEASTQCHREFREVSGLDRFATGNAVRRQEVRDAALRHPHEWGRCLLAEQAEQDARNQLLMIEDQALDTAGEAWRKVDRMVHERPDLTSTDWLTAYKCRSWSELIYKK